MSRKVVHIWKEDTFSVCGLAGGIYPSTGWTELNDERLLIIYNSGILEKQNTCKLCIKDIRGDLRDRGILQDHPQPLPGYQ